MCDGGQSEEEEAMPDLPEFDGDLEKITNGGVTSVNEVLDCLNNPIRRHILYYCRENRIAELDDLAEHIAAMEDDINTEEGSDDSIERCKVNLVHNHLPRLTEANALEYDRRSRTVRYDDVPRLFDWLLKALSRVEGRD